MDRTREVISFTRHLYYFIKMGASLTESVSNLEEKFSDRKLKNALKDLKDKIEKGQTLSKAMEGHGEIFPSDYVKMIEAAEETETLPQVLYELSGYLETVEVTRRNLKLAAYYPGLVINFAFIFIFFIYFFTSDILFNYYVNFIIETGRTISPVAWFFINAGRFVFSPVFMGIMLAGLICVDISLFTRSSLGTGLFLKLPVIKDIFRKSYMARISRALGFMLKQGITPDKALEFVSKTGESGPVKKQLSDAAEKLKSGKTLSEAFRDKDLFDSTFIFMIKQGEKSENLSQALFDAAEYFEDEMKMLYSGMLKFAEPLFILTVGIIVGFLLVCVFLPFYSITGTISG